MDLPIQTKHTLDPYVFVGVDPRVDPRPRADIAVFAPPKRSGAGCVDPQKIGWTHDKSMSHDYVGVDPRVDP